MTTVIMMMSMMVMYYALHERERVLCRTELHPLPRLIKTAEDEAGVDEENDDDDADDDDDDDDDDEVLNCTLVFGFPAC